MLSFFWTYLFPSTSVALVLALLWAQGKRKRAEIDLAVERKAHSETGYQLARAHEHIAILDRYYTEWKAAAKSARLRCDEAEAKAAEIGAKYNAISERIKAAPADMDAEAALGWLATVAMDLKELAEVPR